MLFWQKNAMTFDIPRPQEPERGYIRAKTALLPNRFCFLSVSFCFGHLFATVVSPSWKFLVTFLPPLFVAG